ncbi:hypothetical protein [Mucilaginibacter psychrotolerans]|uniref:Fibronectin type-III domain-containing protein n=1 Tax=Mucilaginibacter psychrotolerans TaxID=1524096 RepID=A0A4Y8S645_9SPHI|nr:hypothetical protein [Mucilaginibacter psychrotolerans]TFF34392.1 hypothetical protein E2R66_22215 [Mucilaginibacter psychrotolerans]
MSKLNKIILTSDILLDIGSPTPGERGQIIVQQNSVGFHKVELPENYFGAIEIEPTPNKSTLIEYIVSDDSIFFTSTILTPADDISDPTAITNLDWNYLDAESVQLQFTAPFGNHTLNADRYNIYYSNAPIDNTTLLKNLQTYKNNIVPKDAGQTEIFNLTKLTPNQIYYIAVVAEKTTYGKTRTAPVSNVITFTTLPLEGGGADGNSDIIIPVKPENISNYLVLFKRDEATGIEYNTDGLVDYTNVVLSGGLPVGKSDKSMELIHTNQYKSDYFNMIQTIIFDLEDEFTVNRLGIYLESGSGDRNVYTSTDGTNYTLAVIVSGDAPKNEWTVLDLDTAVNSDVRYIKITCTNFTEKWAGIVFLGKRQSAQSVRGEKYKNNAQVLTLPQRVGSNANVVESPAFIKKVANTIRLYTNPIWFMEDIPKNKQGGAAAGLINLNNIGYRFATAFSGTINYDNFLKDLHERNIDVVWCNVSGLWFLHSSEVGDNEAKKRNPLDYGVPYTLETSTDPMNYKYFAQHYWQIAARYGNTGGQPDSLFRIDSSDQIRKGLSYVKYWELGINESNSALPDEFAYMNPEQLAALISACWDGHEGAMGAGYGIKDADPTAIPVMVGLAGASLGYKLAMFRWWKANRSDYPVKAMNEHCYNIVGGKPVWENTYAQMNLYSLPPEQGDFISYINEHISYRNRVREFQNIEFWLTEFGYDEHYGSFYAPKAPTFAERGHKKALWIVRSFLLADFLGIDKFLQYCVFGIAFNSELNSDTVQNIWTGFFTSGYLDGPAGAPNRQTQQAFYYSTAFQKAMEGYVYSHAVRVKGASMSNELIVKSADPELWAFAYKPLDSSKKPMLVLWLGNDSLTRSVNIDVAVGGSQVNVNTMSFENLNTSHLEVGTTGTTTSVADGAGKKISIAVTATPKIIYTSNIGTGKLIEPKNIVIQAITTTQIKLAWKDENLGINNTRIFRSINPSTGFVEIHNDYIDTGTFVDTGRDENTAYYYQIQFEKGGILSALSTSYGVQTPKTIAVPGAFGATAKSPSTITFGWTYGGADAAYVDGFELWRSNTIAGTYTRVAVIPNTSLSYTDNGLVANTTYYYKLRAFKGLSSGNYTATLNTTTDPITLVPPSFVSAETGYAGDRLTLKYSLPIDDPSGLESYFTVIEAPGTLNRYIPAIGISLNPNDATKVNIYLASGVTNSSNSIRIAYDGVNGTIQSIYGVKAASLTNQVVSNRFNDSALLSKRIKINLTNDANPSGLSDWNDYSLTNRSYNSTQLVKSVNTDAGATTAYKFVMVEKNPDSHLANIIDVTANQNSYFATGDPVNSQFPIAVRTVTAVMNSDAQAYLTFALMKLDTTKIYNIKLYSWLYPGIDGTMLVKANGTGTGRSINGGGNVSQILTLNNVSPALITLPAVSGDAFNYGYSSPMISINCQNTSGDRSGVTALIIEEVINN